MKFDSPLKFADHLLKAATVELIAFKEGLEIASKLIQQNAQDQIGYLQHQDGPFPEWDELAESTKEDKLRQGYVFNEDYNPLYRTGTLQNSISYEILNPLEAIIGTKDPIGAFQEFGTDRIPPRSFIGRAAYREGQNIANYFGEISIRGIAGGNKIADKVGRELGYHQDIEHE